jgi:hypothetical protein
MIMLRKVVGAASLSTAIGIANTLTNGDDEDLEN